MHKIISYKQLPQGFRPVASGLPFRAAGNVVDQHGAKALLVQVGERFSVYVPQTPLRASPEIQRALGKITETVFQRLARS